LKKIKLFKYYFCNNFVIIDFYLYCEGVIEMALNYGGSPYFNTQSAPMFPQPNGNVYLIQNSLEVANIPTSGGLATVICMPENLMYIKTIQNGQPTLLAYTIAPYEAPKTVPTSTQSNLESRVAALEQQLNAIRQGGGKANVQQSSANNAAVPAESKWDV
jgi:hypothetical protein